MEVVGRDGELAVADAFLEAAVERFTVLSLEGEPGIGKTTIWQEVVERANARGVLALTCAPTESETKLALSALADLLEGVSPDVFRALPEPQQVALDLALLRSIPAGAPPEPRALATAVRSLLAALSDRGPLLVAVDDIQWLDSTSATVLGFAIRRLTDRRIAWLFTGRVDEESRLDVDRLVAPEALTRIRIGPLKLAAIRHVIQRRLEYPLTRPVLVRTHRVSGGNPFFAIEIARDLARPGPGSHRPASVPDSLRVLLSKRLRRLPSVTGEALLAASALAHPTTSLVDEGALAAAEEAELVQIDGDGRVEFGHPLFAAAVYEAATPARRREMHQRLAGIVTDPEERARHLAAATTRPDGDVALALEEGAERARSRGAWDMAAELFERASDLTPPDRPDEVARRALAAAEHHVHAGDRPRARTLLGVVLGERLSRPLRAEALRLLAEVCFHDENFVEAKHLFDEALEYADDPRLIISIELGLGYVHSNLMDWSTGGAHAARALEGAEAIGDSSLAAQGLALGVMMDYLCGKGVAWDKVERSLALEDPAALVSLMRRPSLIEALLFLYVGRYDEARVRLRALRARASDQGDESDLSFVLLWMSWLETRVGDFAAAAALGEECASLAALTGSPTIHGWALTQQAYVQAHLGDVAATRRYCAEASAPVERSGNLLPALWIAASIALVELSLGNAKAAWQACEPMVAAIEQQGIGEPVPLFFLPEALEALVALGELDRAGALIDALEARGRELDRVWALATGARCRALLLAAQGDLDGAAAALADAVVHEERLGMSFAHARTLLVKGVVERRQRQRAQAKQSFEQALEIFQRLGAPLWAERARAELSRVGLRRAAGGGLSGSERRVAELAARGMTIREVAAALFLSPKTVDAHLRRAYQKLGISSRAELGARINELQK